MELIILLVTSLTLAVIALGMLNMIRNLNSRLTYLDEIDSLLDRAIAAGKEQRITIGIQAALIQRYQEAK